MRALKLFILAVFSFVFFSCSNILEQGNASLEICLPGSPDYNARFIEVESDNTFLNQWLPGTVYEIILDGPVYMRKIVNYGDTCSFDNLKCGRYKVSIYNWSSDPYGGPQSWASLYSYGERDIAVMGGKNVKSIDIYALRINNINGISGATVSSPNYYGDITDNKLEISLSSGFGEGLSLLSFVQYSNASISYKGGYKEPLNSEILQNLNNNSYKILKNGNVIYPVGSNYGNSVTFYLDQHDYEVEYTFYDENYSNVLFKSRMPLSFHD